MKKCPFCAEEIQDAAIKCRFCGSMLGPEPVAATAAAPIPQEPATPPAAPPPVVRQAGRLPIAAFVVIGVLLVAIGILLAIRSSDSERSRGAGVSVPTEAASVAPGRPTTGDYQFLDIAWGTSRSAVRTRLEARGFRFLQTDDEGDDQFEGRIEGRDAGVAAMYTGDGLTKFLVVMLAADDNGGLLEHFKLNIANAYGTPAQQRGLATIWPERTGTLVWITMSEDRHVTVHYEGAGWPAESKKRKEGRNTGD